MTEPSTSNAGHDPEEEVEASKAPARARWLRICRQTAAEYDRLVNQLGRDDRRAEWAWARVVLAAELEHQGRRQEAIDQGREAFSLLQGSVGKTLLTNLPVVEWARRELGAALDPGQEVCEKAVALANAGQIGAALACCDEGLTLSPGHSSVLGLKGQILLRIGDARAALVCLEQALVSVKQAPQGGANGAMLWFLKGHACRILRQMDDAVASFKAAVAAQPGFLDGWHALAAQLNELARPEELRDATGAALSVHPGDPVLWRFRAAALAALAAKAHDAQLAAEARVCERRAAELELTRQAAAPAAGSGGRSVP